MPDGAVANFAEADKFEDSEIDNKLVATLNTLVTAAIAAGNGDEYTPPALTWFQIQYALLNGGAYLPAGDALLPTDSEYWWRKNDNNPNAVGVKTKFDEFLEYMYKIADENLTLAEVQANTDIINADVFKDASLDLHRTNTAYYTATTIKTQAAKYLRDLAIAAHAAGYVDEANRKLTINWYQLQYGLLFAKKGALVDAATAIAEGYAWAPQHAKDAAGISLSTMMIARPMMVAPTVEPEVTVTTLEDGRTLTQTIERIYNPETELNDKRITRVWVTREEENGRIRVTTRTLQELLTIDLEALEPVSIILKDETTVTWEDLPQEDTDGTYTTADDAQLWLPEDETTNTDISGGEDAAASDSAADADNPSDSTDHEEADEETGEADAPGSPVEGTSPSDADAAKPAGDPAETAPIPPAENGSGAENGTGETDGFQERADEDAVSAENGEGGEDEPPPETPGSPVDSVDPPESGNDASDKINEADRAQEQTDVDSGPEEDGSGPEAASGEAAISSDPLTKLLLSKTLLSDQEAPASDPSETPLPTPREATAMTVPQTNRITTSLGTSTGTAPGLRGRSTLDPPLLRQSPQLLTHTCYAPSSTQSKFSIAWRAM